MIGNLLTDLPSKMPEEIVNVLAESAMVRIERIVSHGHSSPEGFWYDQDQPEWCLVLQGAARLVFQGREAPLSLKRGDCVNIAAHQKHRVEWTTDAEPTVWLCVHYQT